MVFDVGSVSDTEVTLIERSDRSIVDPEVAAQTPDLTVVIHRDLSPETLYRISDSGELIEAASGPFAKQMRAVKFNEQNVRTLRAPTGPLLSTIATTNDIHFGETEAGVYQVRPLGVGAVIRTLPGEEPFTVSTSKAAVHEMQLINDARGPDLVMVKGDLTSRGTEAEFAEFLSVYQPPFGDRLRYVRGNHDVHSAFWGTSGPFAFEPLQRVQLPGAEIVLLDTSVVDHWHGAISQDQLDQLESIAVAATKPVLVFGHHPVSMELSERWRTPEVRRLVHEPQGLLERVGYQVFENSLAKVLEPVPPMWFLRPWQVIPVGVFDRKVLQSHFALEPTSSLKLLRLFERNASLSGYFAGHTHRTRRLSVGEIAGDQFPNAKSVPLVEVSSTIEFPGSWAEYRIYEEGAMQVVHRISSDPVALRWIERSRWTQKGFMQLYARGGPDDSCFWVPNRLAA